jgi:hypothetical protein
VIKTISKETGANFIYNNQLLKVDKINRSYENKTFEFIINDILKEFDIGYIIINEKTIVLADKNALTKRTGGLIGKVTDNNSNPLIGANVFVTGANLGAATNFLGQYEITNIHPGEYVVRTSFIGYKADTQKVQILEGKKTELNFRLTPESILIGGIEVIGKTDLLPTDVTTKTNITSGEIEHYQATSLGDVLDLVPGIQKTDNPGLNKTNQVAVRSDVDDELSSFGTLIIVDGAPESNNANLQFEALIGSKFGSSNLGKGVDLRTIPADNLESVSILTGLPSVKYGDFTNGIIELKTKIGSLPNRFKFKNNPHTSEGNFNGGVSLGEDALNYNLNIAQSQRDIRLVGDEYTRYTGQLVYSTLQFDKQWQSNYKINGQMTYDEEEPQSDLTQTKNYNRGFSIGFNTWGTVKPTDAVHNFEYNAFLKMQRINSKKSRLQSDFVITPEGDTVAAYIGVLENRGIQWTAGGKLDWNNIFFTGSYAHNFLIGTQFQYDANTGEGVIFDTLFNYYGADSPNRPYTFDDIPGQLLGSIYAQDKVTGHFLTDFSFVAGFRYEMYRPEEFNLNGLWGDGDFVKSKQGTFFNPRFSLMLYLSDVNQFRLNVGKTSKSPPMSQIYPPEDIFTWRNPLDSTINYFRYDRRVPYLKGYQSTQYEISYDHKFFNKIGTTISAYYNERRGQPSSVPNPVFMEFTNGNGTHIFYIDQYSLSTNSGTYYTKCIEFSIKTAKIKPLNLNITVTGSYNLSKKPGSSFSYSLYPDTSIGQYPNYHVPNVSVDTVMGWTYPASGKWEDQIQINYYLKYTNTDLGIWITLRAEQLLKERYQNVNLVPVDYSKLTESSMEVRQYRESIFSKPNKFLFNLNVSKSLFEGTEVSFYVNNFLDDPAIRSFYNVETGLVSEEARNPSLFYGIEFSMIIDKLFK